ncbi:MAG: S-layer homology domain-containing protein [Clostridiales bacterium]|nr:S-layer homology domain-containing protein [Clostridiales bacterium]
MKKRLISGLLAAVALIALFPTALAVPTVETAAQTLAALDIMVGDDSGNLMLDRAVTRAEFTKMTIAASIYGDGAGSETTISPYPDVPYTHWAASYIATAVEAGYVTGYLDGTFRPNHTITLAEGVTMALRLLGYGNADFSGAYPSGQMAMYRALKLNEGVTAASNTTTLTRRDAMALFYNLLTAANKGGQIYLTTLGHTLTPGGEIDLVALVNEAMDGPVVADANWQSRVGFSLSNAAVYRGGRLSSPAAVQAGDLVYWSKSMRTVWAYTNRVTGTYESAAPSAAAPASVIVAGKSYAIETAAAAFDLSDLGAFRTGDTVTLLLGRTGGVAAVQRPAQTASVLYGVVTEVKSVSYTDQGGNAYSANTVFLTATDGNVYSYPTANSALRAGALVQVATGASGAEVKTLSGKSLSGKVASDGAGLGAYILARDVEILDTSETGAALRVYPSRLAGVSLASGMVRFYRLNAKGEIDRLILEDVTGDYHLYGVLTSVQETEGTPQSPVLVHGTYQYDIGGRSHTYSATSSVFGVGLGACQIVMEHGGVKTISNLSPVRISGIEDRVASGSDGKYYALSDSAAVYVYEDGAYYYSDLAHVTGRDYLLTGYYDKAEALGGRIRVVVARESG